MLKNEEKKEIIKANIFLAIFTIVVLMLFVILVVFTQKNNLKNKAEAYTNDVVPYANNQVTDLTGTIWYFNDTIDNSQFASPGETFVLNFISINENFIELHLANMFNRYNLSGSRDNGGSITHGIYFFQNGAWLNQEYRYIRITGGDDSTNLDLIDWLYQNATPQFTEYTISSGLVNTQSNIPLPLPIAENGLISFEFTPSDGYIFNTYNWSITPQNSYTLSNYVEEAFKISFDISNVTSDLTINIEAIPYISLKGQWVLKDFSEMSITATDILDDVYFSSNGHSYYNITALGGDYLKYYSDNLYVDVLSLMPDGFSATPLAYLPTNTYNYNLITISSDYYYGIYTNEYNLPTYLKNITYFTEVFRPATQVDLDLISYKNGQISVLQDEYTFINLFGALIDAPITALKGLLNFTFFGVNLFSFLTLFITLAVVYLCIKMLKGGRKNE